MSPNNRRGGFVKFTVGTQISLGGKNLRNVTVKVTWQFGGEDFELKSERMMRVVTE